MSLYLIFVLGMFPAFAALAVYMGRRQKQAFEQFAADRELTPADVPLGYGAPVWARAATLEAGIDDAGRCERVLTGCLPVVIAGSERPLEMAAFTWEWDHVVHRNGKRDTDDDERYVVALRLPGPVAAPVVIAPDGTFARVKGENSVSCPDPALAAVLRTDEFDAFVAEALRHLSVEISGDVLLVSTEAGLTAGGYAGPAGIYAYLIDAVEKTCRAVPDAFWQQAARAR